MRQSIALLTLWVALLLTGVSPAHAGTTNLDSLELGGTLTVDGATTQTGALTVGGTLTTDGSLDVDAALDASGASSIDLTGAAVDFGSNVPTMATSRTAFLPAQSAGLGGSADPAVELVNAKFTYAFADATTDDVLYYTWRVPDDFDATNSLLHISVVYLCDQATQTEGEWEIKILGIADEEGDAALGSAVTIHDTPSAQNQWDVTDEADFGEGDLSAGDVVFIEVLHDVDDPLCDGNAVNFAGLRIGYTTDTNY